MQSPSILALFLASFAASAALALVTPAPTFAAQDEQDEEPLVEKSEHRWFADFDEAAKVAKAEGKDLLVDFTGSDWCGWCIRLHKEVFAHDTFYEPASKRFVLVALDFPRSAEAKAKVPNPERNRELSEKHEIGGFPTVLVMSPDGEVFGQTGYRPGGAEAYVAYVTKLAASGKAMLAASRELPKRLEEATDKVPVVEEAIRLLDGAVEGAAGAPAIADVARKGVELDPENAKGLKLRALGALAKSGTAKSDELDMIYALDPKNEAGAFESALIANRGLVDSDATANAFIDRMLELAKLANVKDKEAVAPVVHVGIRWAYEPLARKEDAATLLAFAKTLGDVPAELEKLVASKG